MERFNLNQRVALPISTASASGVLAAPVTPAVPLRGVTSPNTIAYAYAIGRIEPRFPNQSVRREAVRAMRPGNAGLTDDELFKEILTKRENRYLARQLCWVLTIQGQDTYIILPRDPLDIDDVLVALRANPRPDDDMDVVVGVLGPNAPLEFCSELQLPIVVFDQIYSFSREELIQAFPRPDSIPEAEFRVAVRVVLQGILQLTDNAGAVDDHRALNYLVMRYPELYALISDGFARNFAFDGVNVLHSRLSGVRKILEVVATLVNRKSGVREKYVVTVDVTEEFPFLVAPLEPYYERV